MSKLTNEQIQEVVEKYYTGVNSMLRNKIIRLLNEAEEFGTDIKNIIDRNCSELKLPACRDKEDGPLVQKSVFTSITVATLEACVLAYNHKIELSDADIKEMHGLNLLAKVQILSKDRSIDIPFKDFNDGQLQEINAGVGIVDVYKYSNPRLTKYDMKYCRKYLEKGIDISKWIRLCQDTKDIEAVVDALELNINPKDLVISKCDLVSVLNLFKNRNVSSFDELYNELGDSKRFYEPRKLDQLKLGYLLGLDYNLYNDMELTADQMHEIRLGLYAGVDVSSYNNKSIGYKEMCANREILQLSLDRDEDYITNLSYSDLTRRKVNTCIKHNVSVKAIHEIVLTYGNKLTNTYSILDLSIYQFRILVRAFSEGIDIRSLCDKELKSATLSKAIEELKQEKEKSNNSLSILNNSFKSMIDSVNLHIRAKYGNELKTEVKSIMFRDTYTELLCELSIDGSDEITINKVYIYSNGETMLDPQ